MKNYYGVTAIAVLMIFFAVSTVSAQVYYSNDVQGESFMKSKPHKQRFLDTPIGQLVDPAAMSKSLAEGKASLSSSAVTEFGPGDKPLFGLIVNPWVRPGEHLKMKLISRINEPGKKYYVSIMNLYPGPSGRYDGEIKPRYPNPDFDFNGEIISPSIFKKYDLQDIQINTDLELGTGQTSIVIYDENGVLAQQIWTDFYITDSGPFEPTFYIDKITKGKFGYTFTGKFPVLPTYYIIGVENYGSFLNGTDPAYAPVPNPEGTSLFIQGGMQFNELAMTDGYLWSPYTRQAISLVKGIKEKPRAVVANK